MLASEVMIDKIFALSTSIRYVAIYKQDRLESKSRSGTSGASSSESDRYEELLVNPTLLKLASQRGNIDCGGLRYLLVVYGSFLVLILPIQGGHVTLGFENGAHPLAFIDQLTGMFEGH